MKLSLCINTQDDSSEGDPEPRFAVLEKVLESELAEIYPNAKNFESVEISLTFTDSESIREMNRTYRNIDEPTDVLSFPMLENEPVGIPELPVLALGDIVICPEQVKKLHPDLNEDESLCLMIAHSFLHLLGYDHDTEEKESEMWQRQEVIAKKLLDSLSRRDS